MHLAREETDTSYDGIRGCSTNCAHDGDLGNSKCSGINITFSCSVLEGTCAASEIPANPLHACCTVKGSTIWGEGYEDFAGLAAGEGLSFRGICTNGRCWNDGYVCSFSVVVTVSPAATAAVVVAAATHTGYTRSYCTCCLTCTTTWGLLKKVAKLPARTHTRPSNLQPNRKL